MRQHQAQGLSCTQLRPQCQSAIPSQRPGSGIIMRSGLLPTKWLKLSRYLATVKENQACLHSALHSIQVKERKRLCLTFLPKMEKEKRRAGECGDLSKL